MTPPLTEEERARLERRRRVYALALALVLLVLGWARATHLDRQVRALPADERAALYARTIRTLEESCTRAPGLAGFCREQAELVRAMPECDDHCQALADRYATLATR